MTVGGFWKWELERRLAVIRWGREDAERAAEGRRVETDRQPVLARRRHQLAVREFESSQMMFGGLEPDAVAPRARRIASEDAEWVVAM